MKCQVCETSWDFATIVRLINLQEDIMAFQDLGFILQDSDVADEVVLNCCPGCPLGTVTGGPSYERPSQIGVLEFTMLWENTPL